MGCSDLVNYLLLFSAVLTAILTTCLIFILIYVKKLSNTLLNVQQPSNPSYPDVNKEELTSYELERLNREDEFDKRIASLKDEVSKQSEVIRRGVAAEELHPLVHNLPHNAVETRHDLSSYEEVAE